LLFIGIPSTGNVVRAAVTPARCAAPPAAAKITFIPLFLASFEKFLCLSGVLCAEIILHSCGIENSFKILLAGFTNSQSD